MATLPNFRSALNGFNRSDVVQYLQSLTTEHEREQQNLKQENQRLQQELQEAQEQLQAAKEEAELLKSTLSSLPQETAEEKASEDVPNLDAPIAPAATVVETAPTNFNELELAAYRRAEMTERMARQRAAASAERMQSVFSQADEKLNLTAQDLQTMIAAFRSDFDQMQQLLETARGIFTESSAGLQAASELCDEG